MTSRIQSVKQDAGGTAPAEIRQLEVRVRVHEPGHQRHMPQVALVAICVVPAALPQPADSAIRECRPIRRRSAGTRWAGPTGPSGALDWPAPRPDAMHNARCTMHKGALHRRIAHRAGPSQPRRTRTPHGGGTAAFIVVSALCIVPCALRAATRHPSVRAAFPALLLAGYFSSSTGTPASPSAFAVASAVMRGTACSRKNGSPRIS